MMTQNMSADDPVHHKNRTGEVRESEGLEIGIWQVEHVRAATRRLEGDAKCVLISPWQAVEDLFRELTS